MTESQPSVPNTPLLQVEGVSKHYQGGTEPFAALHDVSFSVDAGESVAVIGKSGSGKSTLMHLLALLDTPTEGRILLDGVNTSAMNASEVAEVRNRKFGFVFQQFFLIGGSSVLENVAWPLTIAGVGRGERNRRAAEVIDLLDMGDKKASRAQDLSGGQKQRTVIARALVNDPQVIFADEPTGNLDSASGDIVIDTLFELHSDRGITLVIVTHDEDLAQKCDRIITLRDGRIVSDERRSL